MKKLSLSVGIVLVIAAALLLLLVRPWQTAQSTASSTAKSPRRVYVALGDSVAAGVGLDTASDSSACDRTEESYPAQLAHTERYDLTNVSCSGATIASGVAGPQEVNKLSVQPQLEQLYKVDKVRLVTLTIGANDAGWSRVLTQCYGGTCDTPDQAAAARAGMAQISSQLRTALDGMQQHYARAKQTPPTVLVTGYYNVFPRTIQGKCVDATDIEPAEVEYITELRQSLNAAIREATAQTNFAQYVPLDLSGHELCAKDPWIQGLAGSAPFHPTAAGQAALARQLAKTLRAQ